MLSDVLAAPALSWLPSEMRKTVLETTMNVGKAAASPIRCEGWGQGGAGHAARHAGRKAARSRKAAPV